MRRGETADAGLCLLHDLVITDNDEQHAPVAITRVLDDDGYRDWAFVLPAEAQAVNKITPPLFFLLDPLLTRNDDD